MRSPFGYIKNISDRPIPEPQNYTAVELREKHGLERRQHLEAYDAKSDRAPLDETERARLEAYRRRDRDAQTIMIGGVEMRFAPGQVYEVPAEVVQTILAKNPDRLAVITYDEARNAHATEVRLQTEHEARLLNHIVATGRTDVGNTVIEYEDGLINRGGPGSTMWENCPAGPAKVN